MMPTLIVLVLAPARERRRTAVAVLSLAVILATVLSPARVAAGDRDSETGRSRQIARLQPLTGARPHLPSATAIRRATSRLRSTPIIPGATRAVLTCQADLILAEQPTPDRVRVSVVVDEAGRTRAARVLEPARASPMRECLVASLLRLRLPSRPEAARLEQTWELRLD